MKNSKNILQYRCDAEIYYKIGLKYVEKQKFDAAANFLGKATEKEPFNADYQYNFACVLAELKNIKKSNEILTGIIKDIDPTLTECYFGIACNYFDMGDFKKAREYFEKYVHFDHNNQFVDEAYEILYYLQIYDDAGSNSKNDRVVSRLEREGRSLLENGEYKKACLKLEKLIEINPESVPSRNYLALAYFFDGETARAISLAKSIIKLQPDDVLAHSSLALFYANENKMELFNIQLKTLSELEIEIEEDFLVEMKQFLKAILSDSNTKECLKLSIVEILESRRVQIDGRRKKSASNAAPGNLHEGLSKWRKEWEDVIDCALRYRELTYKPDYRNDLKNIWISFMNKAYPEGTPSIRRREIWAATLEYIYCNMNLISVSKKKIAQKYKISPSSITNKLKHFCR